MYCVTDEPPRSQSKLTLLWGLMVKLCSGQRPKLYSYQNSLPRMSVPSLSDTCKELLRSVKPVLDEEEYQKMEALAKVRMLVMSLFYSIFSCVYILMGFEFSIFVAVKIITEFFFLSGLVV